MFDKNKHSYRALIYSLDKRFTGVVIEPIDNIYHSILWNDGYISESLLDSSCEVIKVLSEEEFLVWKLKIHTRGTY